MTRQRIVRAAAAAFAELSFHGASTREIARRAGVGQPLLGYYFESKDELWEAAVTDVFDQLRDALRSAYDENRGDDEAERVRAMSRRWIEFSGQHPELSRIVMQEQGTRGKRMQWIVENHIRPMYERTVTAFQRLIDEGELPPLPPAYLWYLLTSGGPAVFVFAPEFERLTGIDLTDPTVVTQQADAVERLLFNWSRSHPATMVERDAMAEAAAQIRDMHNGLEPDEPTKAGEGNDSALAAGKRSAKTRSPSRQPSLSVQTSPGRVSAKRSTKTGQPTKPSPAKRPSANRSSTKRAAPKRPATKRSAAKHRSR